MTPAIIISLCALFFTVGSFWWLYVRPGRLWMSEVKIFAAYITTVHAVLRLPITLYNTGAKPLIVVDLKATVSSQNRTTVAASKFFRKTIRPVTDDEEDFP